MQSMFALWDMRQSFKLNLYPNWETGIERLNQNFYFRGKSPILQFKGKIWYPSNNSLQASDKKTFQLSEIPETHSTHIKVCDSSEADGSDVERVGDKVHDIPHVTDVLLQSLIQGPMSIW